MANESIREILKEKGWELLPDGRGMRRISQSNTEETKNKDENNDKHNI